jgi:hypothetical protein
MIARALRQVHLPQHRGEARVAVKRDERGIVPEIGHKAVVLLVSSIQPFESLVLLAAPRIDLRDPISKLGERTSQYVKRRPSL